MCRKWNYVQQHYLSRQHQFDQQHFQTIKRKLLFIFLYLSLLSHVKKLNLILILKFYMTLYNNIRHIMEPYYEPKYLIRRVRCVSGITFKQNNLKIFDSKKAKGLKQDNLIDISLVLKIMICKFQE